jgi:cystathionine beta-lyase
MAHGSATPLTTFTLEQLRTRTSEKWRHYEPDVLPLWVAEMDSTIAPSVTEALQLALTEADTGYASGNEYGLAFSEFAAARWGWNVDPEDTIPVIDVMRGIGDVIRLMSEPGAPVVITPPVYYPFARVVEALGREKIDAPLTAAGRLDAATLETACAEAASRGKGGLILISNPHNPTGVAHTRAELEMLAAIAASHGLRIVADEIHAPLMMPGFEFVPILSVTAAENAIVVTSASKSFNLAALKAGLIVGGPGSRAEVRGMKGRVSNGASHWGMLSHVAALRGGGQWLDAVVADISSNSALLTELLAEHLPDAVYQPVEATYLAWVDCRALGLGDDPAAVFLEHGRVAFSSGPTFGVGGEGFIRVNIATTPEVLTEAIRRAGKALFAPRP